MQKIDVDEPNCETRATRPRPPKIIGFGSGLSSGLCNGFGSGFRGRFYGRFYGNCLHAALAFLLIVVSQSAAGQDKTYNKPLYRDTRLDWCLTWGADCGKPAAVAFCNRRRYSDVVVFRAEKVGKAEPTRLIGTDQVCSGQDFCTAFAYITCAGPIPGNRVFANPVWNGNRLDVCLQWGANCGKPAADAFCRENGFSDALHAEPDAGPSRSPTRVISSGQVCDKPFCRGFQQIICR